ncbi:RNA polymerase sigma-70 factor, ECF subfamily [Pseudoxanthobacter soli DSM 19599]|uniref:RNA polymerase sigma-70 factor, ECF subfamily n=1 Tax=Pseudoxanthobacter soli DSM 19599 TaxID=1123029 RepID=A0A1M7ZS33_9HYPH|nr:sigma-70 family RNA polymerase sigma factor [Pseudoxanthobacter soli]SHO67642.1 RNA polymerase sigma-70 factor, ECF subfamily [Pseudoxanthobacter soli DSM 19599]
MTDRERRWAGLMQAALAGDGAAYERLLREIAPAIRVVVQRRLTRIGAPAAECEDIVQETLLALHLKRQSWRTGDPLGPWLWTIARNKMVDHLRRRGRRVEVPVEDFADVLAAPEERPGTEAADVERHLAQLPEKQRDVLRSIAVDGSSIGETAERMKMTPGAVRGALHRAFSSLSARLRTDG